MHLSMLEEGGLSFGFGGSSESSSSVDVNHRLAGTYTVLQEEANSVQLRFHATKRNQSCVTSLLGSDAGDDDEKKRKTSNSVEITPPLVFEMTLLWPSSPSSSSSSAADGRRILFGDTDAEREFLRRVSAFGQDAAAEAAVLQAFEKLTLRCEDVDEEEEEEEENDKVQARQQRQEGIEEEEAKEHELESKQDEESTRRDDVNSVAALP